MSSTPPTKQAPGIRLATVAGVPVYLGPSWLIPRGRHHRPDRAAGRREPPDLGAARAYGVGLPMPSCCSSPCSSRGRAAVTAGRSGFPVHRVVADLWGGHTALDVTRARPGAQRPGRRRRARLQRDPLRDRLSRRHRDGGWGSARTRSCLLVPQRCALALFQPPARSPAGRRPDRRGDRLARHRLSARGRTAAGYAGIAISIGVLWWFIGRPLMAGERLQLGFTRGGAAHRLLPLAGRAPGRRLGPGRPRDRGVTRIVQVPLAGRRRSGGCDRRRPSDRPAAGRRRSDRASRRPGGRGGTARVPEMRCGIRPSGRSPSRSRPRGSSTPTPTGR